MPLSNAACKNAKPKEKLYKLADSGGLCLRVTPNGGKYWVLRYRFQGKEKNLAIGAYPSVSLLEARTKRDNAKKTLNEGGDPSLAKQAAKTKFLLSNTSTFETVANEWLKIRSPSVSEGYLTLIRRRLELDVFPHIGNSPIETITAQRVLSLLREVQDRGSYETGLRLKQYCSRIFKYARAAGLTKDNPADDLSDALISAKGTHYSCIEKSELKAFLKKLSDDSTMIGLQTRIAIRILMLTFVRTGELIGATWDEIDFQNKQWIIPQERMKMGLEHIVPLSKQVVFLLEILKKLNNGKFVFAGRNDRRTHMSNNAILQGIRRMGYAGKMTGHGFRSLAMTILQEDIGYRHKIIDRQLAHTPQKKVDRAYDRAQFLKERTKMMQDYANHIDKIEG